MRWVVVSSLVNDNPGCPYLFNLRGKYAVELKKLPERDFKEFWEQIRCTLSEQERKLFGVEEIRYDLIIALAVPLFSAMTLSYGINSVTKYLGDDSGYTILGSFLIFIVIVIMYFIVGYSFEKLRKRSSM